MKKNDNKLASVATENAIARLDNGIEETTYYSKLKAEEQLFVQFVTFASLSMVRASQEVAKRITALVPGSSVTAESILLEYRMKPEIHKAMEEVIAVKDREYSMMIQNDAMIGRDVLRNIALTSDDEELRLKAADSLMKAAEADYKNKRAKQNPVNQVNNTQVNNTVVWKIESASTKDDLPDENFIDATVTENF